MSVAFTDIAMLLLACALVGALFVRLRQPALIAYIAVGIAAGPAGLDWIQAHEQIHLLSQIGVAVLLFVVGLKLDLHHVRHIGPVALATGLGQLAFTIAIGFGLVLAMGRDVMEALYVAVALTFSSTIIIVKLLSDKRELDALHGRIAVGFLIVQDVAVVVAMMTMSTVGGAGGESDAGWLAVAGTLAGKLAATALLMFVLMRWVLPFVTAAMARSQELLLVFAVAWGVALAALGEWVGFSREAGAFLAGFSLASTPWREAMYARLTGLRDFLLLFFFIHLGASLELGLLGEEVLPAIALSVFVLIGNPLIVMAIMGFMGYRRRTGFLAGLTVAQISEFSIVFVAMGITLGHVDGGALGLTTMVGLITITVSTYMILYSQWLYERLGPWLGWFERQRPFREMEVSTDTPAGEYEAVVFGLGRYGSRVLARLHEAGVRVLGVDFDPETIHRLRARNLPVCYGDGQDSHFVESLPLTGVRRVITTLPDWESDRQLFHALHEAGYDGSITATARSEAHGRALRDAGVARVLTPYHDAADHSAQSVVVELRPEPPPAAPQADTRS